MVLAAVLLAAIGILGIAGLGDRTPGGIPTVAHSSHNIRVSPSMPSTAETTNRAASAARRPARSSPTKSA